MSSGRKITKNRLKSNKPLLRNEVYSFKSQHWRKMCIREKRTSNQFCLLTNTVDFFLWLLPGEHKANETKDNKNGTSLFAELKLLYANSVWITKNNVKANIWKLYMIFEANKEIMENLSVQKEGNKFLFSKIYGYVWARAENDSHLTAAHTTPEFVLIWRMTKE